MHISANGLDLAYDDRGEGLPVLFIHGYPLNRQLWAPQIQGLGGSGRLLALDLRGHGESQVVPGPYWMDLLANDCAAFLDALGITRPVVLCGLSMGGYIAMAFYRQHGPRLAGLVLAATRSGADTAEGRENRDKAIALAHEKGPQAIAAAMLPKMMAPRTYDQNSDLVEGVSRMMASLPVEAIEGDLIGMRERPDSAQTLAEIQVPVLILHGADDQIIPAKAAEQEQKNIPHAQIEIIPGAGHLLNLEQPERFNAAVRRFLEAIGS